MSGDETYVVAAFVAAHRALAMSVPASGSADLLARMKQSIGGYPHPILTNLAMGVAPPVGQVLGFEVLGFDQGQLHTWLCYGLHKDAAEDLGVFPHERGLVSTLAEARLIADTAIIRATWQ
jgi:hypothetical protein